MATAGGTAATLPPDAPVLENPTLETATAHAPSPAPPPRLSPTATTTSSRSRFFTTASSRPFSRSALQRQSVHTLPSIHHLQHGFAKLGLLAQVDSHPRAAPPPRRTSSTSGVLQPPVEHTDAPEHDAAVLDALGPQPNKPLVDLRMPWERDEALARPAALKDEAQLREEAYEALDAVCDCWSLAPGPTRPPRRRPSSSIMSRNPSTASSIPPPSPIDDPSLPFPDGDLPLLPTLLATTTLAVRAIQAFAVSLPSTSASLSPAADSREDPLVALRRTSLDVLGMLRELEARYRLPSSLAAARNGAAPLSAGVDVGRRARAPQDEVGPPHGPRPVAPDSAPQQSPPAPQYRADVVLSALEIEARLVERWVRAVEGELERSEVRVGAAAGGGRRRSSGLRGGEGQMVGAREGDEGEGEALPDWARETGWPDGLARAYAIILAYSSAATAEHALPDPAADRDGFLDALSDGTLLLGSFNAVLRHSPWSRPFGFIPSSSIHAFPPLATISSSSSGAVGSASMSRTASAASDGGERVGATFRRAENLGQWSAALKHRYALSLGPPPFDPRLVAARKPESAAESHEMLARAVEGWGEAVASEAREVQAERGAHEQGRLASGVGLSEAAGE
ncbi:hypothetical protein JCM8208_005061 [Rhodotorula glutinis]